MAKSFTEIGLNFDADTLCEILKAVDIRREHAARDLAGIGQEEDPDYQQFVYDQVASAELLADETAELVSVGAYHWVERELKTCLEWLGEPRAAVAGMDAPARAAAFARHGVDLTQLPNYNIAELARRFANSWKHNPSIPSDQLLGALGVARAPDMLGLLRCAPIRAALIALLAVTAPGTGAAIATALVHCLRLFLIEAYRAAGQL